MCYQREWHVKGHEARKNLVLSKALSRGQCGRRMVRTGEWGKTGLENGGEEDAQWLAYTRLGEIICKFIFIFQIFKCVVKG